MTICYEITSVAKGDNGGKRRAVSWMVICIATEMVNGLALVLHAFITGECTLDTVNYGCIRIGGKQQIGSFGDGWYGKRDVCMYGV